MPESGGHTGAAAAPEPPEFHPEFRGGGGGGGGAAAPQVSPELPHLIAILDCRRRMGCRKCPEGSKRRMGCRKCPESSKSYRRRTGRCSPECRASDAADIHPWCPRTPDTSLPVHLSIRSTIVLPDRPERLCLGTPDILPSHHASFRTGTRRRTLRTFRSNPPGRPIDSPGPSGGDPPDRPIDSPGPSGGRQRTLRTSSGPHARPTLFVDLGTFA